MKTSNRTPFVTGTSVVLDRRGGESVVVMVKGTFTADTQSDDVRVAEEQDPIQAQDEFYGEPGLSSIARGSEMGPLKPSTDVFLRGRAIPTQPGTSVGSVSVRVGPLVQEAVVYGQRRWRAAMGVPTPSHPEPFDAIPLVWELAFGGTDTTPPQVQDHGWDPRNPIGIGFRARGSTIPIDGAPLPQIEDPRGGLDRPDQHTRPIGFGPVGRLWHPRAQYAGTYDAAWQAERMPLLPRDFDDRFLNSAPTALISPTYLEGGEMVEVRGCTASGRLAFALPKLQPTIRMRMRTRDVMPEMRLETVIVDSDASRVSVLWKGQFEADREVPHLEEMIVDLEGELPA